MKELAVDFGRIAGGVTTHSQSMGSLWRVPHFTYLEVQISKDLNWSPHTEMMIKKAP